MEEKYPAPPEIIDALKMDLKLNPLIRYVNTLKAANTVPPSYEVRLINGASFFLIYEDFSLAVKIEAKKYYLGDMEELTLAKQHLNRILQEPQFTKGEDSEESGEEAGGEEAEMEPEAGGEEGGEEEEA